MTDTETTYAVYVDDNFHYQDESERYHLGDFPTLGAAVAACRKIVDDYLASAFKPGMSAAELYNSYTSFGEDPFIRTKAPGSLHFSAWTYAKERCEAICSGRARADGKTDEDASAP